VKRAWTVLVCGLVVIAAAFAVGVTDGHLGLDDWGYTGGCPFVRGGLTGANMWRALTETGYGAIWMPVTFVSYMADISLFGGGWPVHHAVNVVLHLVTVVLAFCLLRRLARVFVEPENRWTDAACALAVLLWAVHPMRAEAVTYVASRKEVLWTLFALAGLLAYGRFLRVCGMLYYFLTFVCFVLAVMSKPTAMCFPLLLMVLQGVNGWANRSGNAVSSPSPEKRVSPVLCLLPFLLGAVTVGCLTLVSQGHPTNGEAVGVYDACFAWRCLNAAVSSGLYCWYTLVPTGIHMDYRAVFDGWPVNGTLGLVSLAVVLAGVVLAFVRGGRRARTLTFVAVALFVVTLAPTLGVFGYVNGDQAMADRYTYFPHLALALVMSVALAHGLVRGARWRGALLVLSVLALCAEVAALLPVERAFESDAVMAARILARDPDHWRALRVQGNELCARQNRTDEGVELLRKSLKLRPSQRTAESLAYVLAVRGRAEDAVEVRRLGASVAAVPSRDTSGMMLDALGLVSMKAGDYAQAARYFAQALRAPARQHSADYACLRLGQCLVKLGKTAEAREPLSRAARSRDQDIAVRARVLLRAAEKGPRKQSATSAIISP